MGPERYSRWYIRRRYKQNTPEHIREAYYRFTMNEKTSNILSKSQTSASSYAYARFADTSTAAIVHITIDGRHESGEKTARLRPLEPEAPNEGTLHSLSAASHPPIIRKQISERVRHHTGKQISNLRRFVDDTKALPNMDSRVVFPIERFTVPGTLFCQTTPPVFQ